MQSDMQHTFMTHPHTQTRLWWRKNRCWMTLVAPSRSLRAAEHGWRASILSTLCNLDLLELTVVARDGGMSVPTSELRMQQFVSWLRFLQRSCVLQEPDGQWEAHHAGEGAALHWVAAPSRRARRWCYPLGLSRRGFST